MQDMLVTAASLVYAAVVLEAWRVLPAPGSFKMTRLVLIPGFLGLLALCGALLAPFLRRVLLHHLWVSYRTGFGQSATSILGGVGVLIALAIFSLWPVLHPDQGGPRLGGGFSAYGAGVGLLLAEAILVRRLEADPVLRGQIETPDPPRS